MHKRRVRRRADRDGEQPPPEHDPWEGRAPRLFATRLEADFPYEHLGLGPQVGDIVERHGSITAYHPIQDEAGVQVPDRMLCLHVNTGSFAVLSPGGASSLPILWGIFTPEGHRVEGEETFSVGPIRWRWYQEVIRDLTEADETVSWVARVCGRDEIVDDSTLWTPAYAARSVKLRRSSASDAAHRRRERLRRATVPGPRIDPLDVYARDGWVCQLCRSSIDPTLRHPDPRSASLDHLIPLAVGGLHETANCQASHLVCNLRKGARQRA